MCAKTGIWLSSPPPPAAQNILLDCDAIATSLPTNCTTSPLSSTLWSVSRGSPSLCRVCYGWRNANVACLSWCLSRLHDDGCGFSFGQRPSGVSFSSYFLFLFIFGTLSGRFSLVLVANMSWFHSEDTSRSSPWWYSSWRSQWQNWCGLSLSSANSHDLIPTTTTLTNRKTYNPFHVCSFHFS